MIISLPKEYSILLREVDLSEITSCKISVFEQLEIELADSDYQDFMISLNDAIVTKGMDDNDTVNQLGKSLYKLYDAIREQKN